MKTRPVNKFIMVVMIVAAFVFALLLFLTGALPLTTFAIFAVLELLILVGITKLLSGRGFASFMGVLLALCLIVVNGLGSLALAGSYGSLRAIFGGSGGASRVMTAVSPFNVYISGTDTEGEQVPVNSRSDVNLIATVNPLKKEILLTSIPRDYYVETVCEPDMGCMNGQMDKLTHTGLHGVETTEMTLEKLLGITINYNAKINFASLTNVVNELGGVDLYNPNEFTSTHGNYYFPVGNIHLSGEEVIGFVRERYSFADGDRERGRNQMRVLTAIINKAASPSSLGNLPAILSSASETVQTNMTIGDMAGVAMSQLFGGHWTIYQYSLTGPGGTDYAAELGDNAYVMYQDADSIAQGKANIEAVEKGEKPPYASLASE